METRTPNLPIWAAFAQAVSILNIPLSAARVRSNVAVRGPGTICNPGDNYDDGQTNGPASLTNIPAIPTGAWYNLALKNDESFVA